MKSLSSHPSSIAVSIGSRVRAKRLELGMSQEDFAAESGISVDDLSTSEEGKTDFTASEIVDMCAVLRVKPSWFFDGLLE